MGEQADLQAAMRHGGRIWAFCLGCGHADRLDAWALVQHLGRNVSLEELGRLLKCDRCKGKHGLAVLDPTARSPTRD